MIIDAHAHAYGPDAVGPVAQLQVERTIAYGPTSMEKKPGH